MTAETAPSTVAPPGGEAGSKYQYYDPECARMEAWLDEHPDFVQDYFLRYYICWNYSQLMNCKILKHFISIFFAISFFSFLRSLSIVLYAGPFYGFNNFIRIFLQYR
jgi:hypothetical protein